MYERIMVGIDDDTAANQVLPSAIALAAKFGARLALCHALDATPLAQSFARVALPDGVAPVEASLRATAMEFLEAAAAKVREASVLVEVIVVESECSHAADLLLKAASDWRADLLVVGGHKSSGVARLLVGGLAEQLASKSDISLLLVRSSS